ncbi:MAG TPA: hypothetical protein PK957_04525 [Candidatus Dojkabacteria bacterium]|nr:hypothetical protein [Candidatus Dojkabacteria bacterium]HQF36679.1 hypothetical protein [Candidatus Dojkabacteria bacterium]
MNNIGNNGLVVTGNTKEPDKKTSTITASDGHHIIILQCPGCGEEVEKTYKCPICGEHMKVVSVIDSADIDDDIQKDLDAFDDIEPDETEGDFEKDDSVAKTIDPFEI